MASSSYDYPATGGGPSSGLNQTQVDDRISTLVNAIALQGNTTVWPSNKVPPATVGNTDTISEGTTNLFFTNARALAVASARLGFFLVDQASANPDLTVTGNSTTITADMLNKVVDFRGQSLTADHELSFDDAIGAEGDVIIVINEASSANGYNLTINGDLRFSSSIVLGHADAAMVFKTSDSDDWRVIARWNLDTGDVSSFLELTDTPQAFTADKWVKVNAAGTALEFVDAPSGGGGTTFTPSQSNLFSSINSIVKAGTGVTIDRDTTNNTLTFNSTAQGGGSTFTLTMAILRPVLNNTLLVDSTLTKTVDTTGNTITLGVASSTTPTGTHMFYVGHQDSLDFTSWVVGNAENSYDVSAPGAMITTVVTNVPDDDYVYLVAPQDREPVSVLDGIGAESVNDFAEQVGAVTINSVSYNVYTFRNISGITVPNVTYRITVES